MKPAGTYLTNENVHSVLGMIRSAYGPQWESPEAPAPFVTISRQTGAGGADLGRELIARLNERDRRAIDDDGRHWTLWDHELVHKVATDHNLPESDVASLEESKPTWLGQFLASLPTTGMSRASADEFTVFRRVAVTVRALAQAGRVVIVGRGASFITANMPLGTRVRLVAPMQDRVRATVSEMSLSYEAAERIVREKDELRLAYFNRHWPNREMAAESFTTTINTAALRPEQIVESVIPLVAMVSVASRTPVTVG